MNQHHVTRLGNLTLLAAILSLFGGCAGMARTEGTSGPIAWRVTDLATVTRNIQGQRVETYDFNLEIRNVNDRTITLTRMHRTVYNGGGGQPGYANTTGRWELRPGGEWKFPLYSYTYCTASQGCLNRGGAQPLWQIVFTGVDNQDRQVQVRLDITMPPQPMKHVDLGVIRRAALSSEPPPVGEIGNAPKPTPHAAPTTPPT